LTSAELARFLAEKPIVAAPMAGLTDHPFRRILREFSDGLIHTEMISTEAVTFRSPRTERMIATVESETPPVAIQVMGGREESLRRALPRIMKYRPEIIDINLACPVPKIIRSGAGAALLENLPLAAALVCAAKEESGIAVTAKIRLGRRKDELERIMTPLIEAGVAALTIHGRTATQMYAGRAERERVLGVIAGAPIPIIVSGDVREGKDVAGIRAAGGGVLVARGMIGRPWFLAEAIAIAAGTPVPPTPSRRATALRHLQYVIAYHGEGGIPPFRRHLVEYARGIPGAPALRHALVTAPTAETVRRALEEIPE
jgi:tRNA-dihydrouridine synthase B